VGQESSERTAGIDQRPATGPRRPAVPESTAGWGAKGELRIEAIERAALRG
jgi:hypothetical protein